MLSLLVETFKTLRLRWQDMIRCFWPFALWSLFLWYGLLPTASLAPNRDQADGRLWFAPLSTPLFLWICLMIAVFVLGFGIFWSNAAVKWHRSLIAGEAMVASPGWGSEKGWIYAMKSVGFGTCYVVILFVVAKLFGLSLNDQAEGPKDPAALALFHILPALVTSALYVLLFSKWALTLPDGALDAPLRTGKFTLRGRAWINLAAALFLADLPFTLLQSLVDDGLASTALTLVSSLLDVTILAVAYRQTLPITPDAARNGSPA